MSVDTVLAALPHSVAGLRGRKAARSRAFFASYGNEKATVMIREVPTAQDPSSMLVEMGSSMMCADATVTGTAPLRGAESASDANDVWFGCQVSRKADAEIPGAMALGRTSGRLIWVMTAPDRQAMTEMVDPLAEVADTLPGDGPGTPAPTEHAATAPFGLEDASWPTHMQAAWSDLTRLPPLDGHRPRLGRPSSMTVAEYAAGDYVVLSHATRGINATAMLAATFGLVMTCERGTFQGTALGIPGGRPTKAPSGAEVRWFTCDVKGEEGNPAFRGHVVGWTYKDLAWLAVGTTAERAEALVHALVSQAQ